MLKLRTRISAIAATASMLAASIVHAQGTGGGGGAANIPNPLGTNDLYTFFLEVIQVIIQAGTYVLVVMIIYSGFLFVTAQGSEPQIARARQALLYSVIGGGVLLGAWIIATAVANTVASL